MGTYKGGGAMNWMDYSLQDFQDALASSDPTPGGGTAAAVALGQASALTKMVVGLTIGKEKWDAGWPDADVASGIVDSIYERAGQLAKLDSDAFDEVMAAFKMSKSTDEEVSTRRESIRMATLKAAEVPFETVELGMKLLSCHQGLALRGNANAVSDVGVAALLASAAVKGALFNVEINLQSLPMEMGTDLRKKVKGIRKSCSEVSREIMHAVHDRIAQ